MRREIALIATALSLLGCSTPYIREGWRGGYSEERLGERQFLVSFEGNGYTREITVHKYFLLRCAELTLESGFRYFQLLEANREVGGMGIPTGGTFSSFDTGYGTHGSFYPGVTIPVSWYSRIGMIRFLTEEEARVAGNVFDADDLWASGINDRPPPSPGALGE